MSKCLIWTGYIDSDGYGQEGRCTKVHQRAWRDVHGEIPSGMVVMHECDNPACYNVGHLKIGTQAQNLADMARRGRSALGEKNGQHKITADDVKEIRRRSASGEQQKSLADAFGVSQPNVSNIIKRKLWKHL